MGDCNCDCNCNCDCGSCCNNSRKCNNMCSSCGECGCCCDMIVSVIMCPANTCKALSDCSMPRVLEDCGSVACCTATGCCSGSQSCPGSNCHGCCQSDRPDNSHRSSDGSGGSSSLAGAWCYYQSYACCPEGALTERELGYWCSIVFITLWIIVSLILVIMSRSNIESCCLPSRCSVSALGSVASDNSQLISGGVNLPVPSSGDALFPICQYTTEQYAAMGCEEEAHLPATLQQMASSSSTSSTAASIWNMYTDACGVQSSRFPAGWVVCALGSLMLLYIFLVQCLDNKCSLWVTPCLPEKFTFTSLHLHGAPPPKLALIGFGYLILAGTAVSSLFALSVNPYSLSPYPNEDPQWVPNDLFGAPHEITIISQYRSTDDVFFTLCAAMVLIGILMWHLGLVLHILPSCCCCGKDSQRRRNQHHDNNRSSFRGGAALNQPVTGIVVQNDLMLSPENNDGGVGYYQPASAPHYNAQQGVEVATVDPPPSSPPQRTASQRAFAPSPQQMIGGSSSSRGNLALLRTNSCQGGLGRQSQEEQVRTPTSSSTSTKEKKPVAEVDVELELLLDSYDPRMKEEDEDVNLNDIELPPPLHPAATATNLPTHTRQQQRQALPNKNSTDFDDPLL